MNMKPYDMGSRPRQPDRQQPDATPMSSPGKVVLDAASYRVPPSIGDSIDCSSTQGSNGQLVSSTLDALAACRRPLSSLAVRNLSSPLEVPQTAATLSYLASCGLEELELRDVSIERAAAEGTSNLLRAAPAAPAALPMELPVSLPSLHTSLADSVRARGAAMIRLTLTVPSLRRLTLCNAAFSAADVASLSALTQLEELDLIGAMECGAGSVPFPSCAEYVGSCPSSPAEVAASAHQRLLSALPNLRRLTLPMAILSATATDQLLRVHSFDSDDEDISSAFFGVRSGDLGRERGLDETPDQPSAVYSSDPSCHAPFANDTERAGRTARTGVAAGGLGSAAVPMSASASTSVRRNLFGGGGGGGSSASTSVCRSLFDGIDSTDSNASSREDVSPAAPGTQPPSWGSQVCHHRGAAPATNGTHADQRGPRTTVPLQLGPQHQQQPLQCRGDLRVAAAGYPVGANAESVPSGSDRGGGNAGTGAASSTAPAPAPSWRFPPRLEELTLPLCALNAPLFHAVCEEYGGQQQGQGRGQRGGCGLRALHVPCASGYTVWEGSFLCSDRDFRSLSRLSSLESLHLSLELGGSGRGALRRSGLRACLQHLRALKGLKELRLSETRQPVCFSARKRDPSAPGLMSYLVDEADDTPAQPGLALRLPVMPRLGDPLHRSPFIPPRPVLTPLGFDVPSAPRAPSPPAAPSASSLQQLLSHWPQLQTLAVSGQTLVRRTAVGGPDRLVPLMGEEQAEGAL